MGCLDGHPLHPSSRYHTREKNRSIGISRVQGQENQQKGLLCYMTLPILIFLYIDLALVKMCSLGANLYCRLGRVWNGGFLPFPAKDPPVIPIGAFMRLGRSGGIGS